MSVKRDQILDAVKALVQGALPYADVVRNRDKPESIAPGGTVVIRDGEPGDAEVTLSPITYTYEHRIPLEIGAYDSAGKTAAEVLSAMLAPIGEAVLADRFLGGLCAFLDVTAPSIDGIESYGVAPGRWADVDILATYSTRNPLG